jgi:hypothetical protein
VKDNFKSDQPHNYKQVWQGHYSFEEAPNLIRSTFDDASGLDIYQIRKTDIVESSGKRGKQWSVVSKNNQKDFNFITILYPYKGYDNRIDEDSDKPKFKDWELNNSDWKMEGVKPVSLSKENKSLFFSVSKLELNTMIISFSEVSDMFLKFDGNHFSVQSLNEKEMKISFKNNKTLKTLILRPGETIEYKIEQY